MTIFIFIVIAIAILFLVVNFLLAPHNPYQEKYSIFECGFHSFLGQNRAQFSVMFYVFGFVFLLLDIEVLLIYPFAISGYSNGAYGLITTLGFLIIITFGFVFELGKSALKIDSKQYSVLPLVKKSSITTEFVKGSSDIKLGQTRSFHTSNSLHANTWQDRTIAETRAEIHALQSEGRVCTNALNGDQTARNLITNAMGRPQTDEEI